MNFDQKRKKKRISKVKKRVFKTTPVSFQKSKPNKINFLASFEKINQNQKENPERFLSISTRRAMKTISGELY